MNPTKDWFWRGNTTVTLAVDVIRVKHILAGETSVYRLVPAWFGVRGHWVVGLRGDPGVHGHEDTCHPLLAHWFAQVPQQHDQGVVVVVGVLREVHV